MIIKTGDIIKFEIKGDKRGSLISLESNKNIPFEIKRVYYFYGSLEDVVRGKHAHKNLKQIMVAINGSCKVLLDNGLNKKIVKLEKKNEGLFISNNTWREVFDFTPDCIVIVFANDFFNEEDYIRDYKEFKSYLEANEA